jgi:hypothetical protein
VRAERPARSTGLGSYADGRGRTYLAQAHASVRAWLCGHRCRLSNRLLRLACGCTLRWLVRGAVVCGAGRRERKEVGPIVEEVGDIQECKDEWRCSSTATATRVSAAQTSLEAVVTAAPERSKKQMQCGHTSRRLRLAAVARSHSTWLLSRSFL